MSPTHFLSLVDTMARLSLRAEARRLYFGYFWWVLEPLLYVGVFWLVFYQFLGSRTPDFLMFLAIGKLTFIWFSKTVNYASNSLVSNAGLIARMDMPKALFPLSVILECSYRQIAVFALLIVFLLADGRMPDPLWLWTIPLALVQAILIIACGLIAAILVCYSRDFGPLINLGMIFMMFMSGVFWDLNDIANPAAVDLLLTWNPVAFLLHSYRQVLLWGETPDWVHLMWLSGALVVAILLIGRYLSKYSRHIARRVITA